MIPPRCEGEVLAYWLDLPLLELDLLSAPSPPPVFAQRQSCMDVDEYGGHSAPEFEYFAANLRNDMCREVNFMPVSVSWCASRHEKHAASVTHIKGICIRLHFTTPTIFLSVSIVTRYISHMPVGDIDSLNFDLLAAAAVLVAAKMKETKTATRHPEDFLRVLVEQVSQGEASSSEPVGYYDSAEASNIPAYMNQAQPDAYTQSELIAMEVKLLQKLNFSFDAPTPADYLLYFMSASVPLESPAACRFRQEASWTLAMWAVCDSRMSRYRPSLVSATALFFCQQSHI